MKVNSGLASANGVALAALGVLGALLAFAVLSGRPVPLVSGPRGAFFVLLAIGIVMCALGPLRGIQPGDWTRPMTIVAASLGGLALLLGIAVLFRLPLVRSERSALVVLVGIILVKVVLATTHQAWLSRLGR